MAKYNMTDLVERIAQESEISKKQAKDSLDATLEGLKAIIGDMEPNDKLTLVGSLSFEVSHRKAYEAHKPTDINVKVPVPAKNVLRVKAGKDFKDLVQQ